MHYYSQYYLLSRHFPTSLTSYWLFLPGFLHILKHIQKVIFPISPAHFFRISVSLEAPPTSELLKLETLNLLQHTPFSLRILLFPSPSFPNHCTSLAQPFLPSHLDNISGLFTGLFDSLATHPAQVTRWPFRNFNSVNVTPLAKTCTGFFLIAHRINLALGALESWGSWDLLCTSCCQAWPEPSTYLPVIPRVIKP